MTAILNRNRLLRLAGVLLLTAAIAIIPVGAAFADSRGGAQTDSAVFPPVPPINLSGTFREENAGNFVELSWQDPEGTVNPMCYSAPVIACWLGGFGLSGHGPADSLDAPTEYVVERRQPRQQNTRGFYMNGEHDWTEIATLTGTDGGAPATSYRDSQWGAPSRTMEFPIHEAGLMSSTRSPLADDGVPRESLQRARLQRLVGHRIGLHKMGVVRRQREPLRLAPDGEKPNPQGAGARLNLLAPGPFTLRDEGRGDVFARAVVLAEGLAGADLGARASRPQRRAQPDPSPTKGLQGELALNPMNSSLRRRFRLASVIPAKAWNDGGLPTPLICPRASYVSAQRLGRVDI